MFFIHKLCNFSEKVKEQDTFVATIIHDLKNPLIAHCRILEKLIKNSKEEKTKEYCKQMLSSTRLLLEMVFSLSETYKYDSCKLSIKKEEVNILEMAKSICLELSSLTDDESLLNIKASGSPIIFADKLHLRRVISNLISNAIKYKREDSIITIEINSTNNKSLSFSVTNQGHFIPKNIQKTLFQKYVCKNAKFNSHSTGLGLYLSEQIIKLHKGKMFVKSTKGGTNTFGFVIPTSTPIYFANKTNSQDISAQ